MLWNHPVVGFMTTPYVFIFVLAWLFLKLIDLMEVQPRTIFWILRVVTVIVAIVLVIL